MIHASKRIAFRDHQRQLPVVVGRVSPQRKPREQCMSKQAVDNARTPFALRSFNRRARSRITVGRVPIHRRDPAAYVRRGLRRRVIVILTQRVLDRREHVADSHRAAWGLRMPDLELDLVGACGDADAEGAPRWGRSGRCEEGGG